MLLLKNYSDLFKLDSKSIPTVSSQNSSTYINPKVYLSFLKGSKENYRNFTQEQLPKNVPDSAFIFYFLFFWAYLVGRSLYVFADILEDKEKIIEDSIFSNQIGELYIDLILPNYIANIFLTHYSFYSSEFYGKNKISFLEHADNITVQEYGFFLKNNWYHFEKIDEKNFLFKFPIYFFVNNKKEKLFISSEPSKFLFISFCFFIKDLLMGMSRHFSFSNGKVSYYFESQISLFSSKYSRFLKNINKNFTNNNITFVSEKTSNKIFSNMLDNAGSKIFKKDYSFLELFGGIFNVELIYLDILLGTWSHFLIMYNEDEEENNIKFFNQKSLANHINHICPVFGWNFNNFLEEDLNNFLNYVYPVKNKNEKIPFFALNLWNLQANNDFIGILVDPDIYRTVCETSPYVLFFENFLERILITFNHCLDKNE